MEDALIEGPTIIPPSVGEAWAGGEDLLIRLRDGQSAHPCKG